MVNAVLNILRTYPACDIERKSDKQIIRKQVNPSELTEELLKSYATLHGDLVLVPKKMQGNAPYRQENDAITLTRDSLLPPAPAPMLSGFDGYPSHQSSGSNDMYKIMYEREREEAKEYKRKYEETLTELRKNEIELAGKKPDVIGDVVKGLAGFAPMLMGGGGVASLGATPQQEQPKQPSMQPISDKRLAAIIGYWPKIDEQMKDGLYKVIASILTTPENLGSILSLLEEEETQTNY